MLGTLFGVTGDECIMSLTPISQYASTAATFLRIRSNVGSPQSPKAQVQSLASGEVLQGSGQSAKTSVSAKGSLNVAYDRLSLQADIGPAAHLDTSLQSFLASYQQNSGAESSSQSSGTLFKSSA